MPFYTSPLKVRWTQHPLKQHASLESLRLVSIQTRTHALEWSSPHTHRLSGRVCRLHALRLGETLQSVPVLCSPRQQWQMTIRAPLLISMTYLLYCIPCTKPRLRRLKLYLILPISRSSVAHPEYCSRPAVNTEHRLQLGWWIGFEFNVTTKHANFIGGIHTKCDEVKIQNDRRLLSCTTLWNLARV